MNWLPRMILSSRVYHQYRCRRSCLRQLAAPPGAPSRATSSSCAAVNARSTRPSARATAAAAAASSRRRRGVACGVARRGEATRGGAVQAAAARAAAARTLAESAWVARTPRAPPCSGRTSFAPCMCARCTCPCMRGGLYTAPHVRVCGSSRIGRPLTRSSRAFFASVCIV